MTFDPKAVGDAMANIGDVLRSALQSSPPSQPAESKPVEFNPPRKKKTKKAAKPEVDVASMAKDLVRLKDSNQAAPRLSDLSKADLLRLVETDEFSHIQPSGMSKNRLIDHIVLTLRDREERRILAGEPPPSGSTVSGPESCPPAIPPESKPAAATKKPAKPKAKRSKPKPKATKKKKASRKAKPGPELVPDEPLTEEHTAGAPAFAVDPGLFPKGKRPTARPKRLTLRVSEVRWMFRLREAMPSDAETLKAYIPDAFAAAEVLYKKRQTSHGRYFYVCAMAAVGRLMQLVPKCPVVKAHRRFLASVQCQGCEITGDEPKAKIKVKE